MTGSDDTRDLKKSIRDVLSSTEELKSLFPPLMRNQEVATQALKSHAEAISALMTELLGSNEEHERLAKKLEIISDKSEIFEERLKSNESFHDLLDQRMTALEIQEARGIDRRIRDGETPSKTELKTIEGLIKTHQDNAELIGIKARVLRSMGDALQAIKWIEDSILRYPKEPYLWYTKGVILDISKSEDRIKCFDKSLELVGEDRKVQRHIIYHARASVLAQSRSYADALSSAEKAVEYEPGCAQGWSLKGTILKRLNRIPESLGCYEKSLELDPRSPEAWLGKGQAVATLGPDYYQEAIVCFDKSIELAPTNPDAYTSKANVLLDMKLPAKALDSVEKALTLDPKNYCAWCRKGLALMDLERYPDAPGSFDKSLELGAQDCVVFTYKTVALVEAGRVPEARSWLASLDEKKMTDASSLNGYSWSLYKVGEFKKGVEIARRAIEMDPNEARTWDTLACNLAGMMNFDSEALEAFRKAMSLKKTDSAIDWKAFKTLCQRMGLHEDAAQAETKIRESKIDK